MAGVAIVGIGMHPFGRHPTASRGAQQAVTAAQLALADAGIGWADVQFAFGGSRDGGDADTLVADLGLTGLPFDQRLERLRHRRQRADDGRLDASAPVPSTWGSPSGSTSTPAGPSTSTRSHGLGSWYGESGLMLTTQFFGLKIQRYLHEHGIEPIDAGEDRRQGVPQRRAQPERLATDAAVGGGDRRVDDGQPPADQVHVLLAGRGRGGPVLCRADLARQLHRARRCS